MRFVNDDGTLTREAFEWLNAFVKAQQLDGRLFEAVAVAAGVPQAVPHGLKRNYVGFDVRRNSAGTVLAEDYGSATRNIDLRFTPTLTGTVDLWIF
jgi:hypothetical protein